MNQPDYEAQYLALCAQHEGLRRECPCGCHFGWAKHLLSVVTPRAQTLCEPDCPGWLPLPEAERLGALVEVFKGRVEFGFGDDYGHPIFACRVAIPPWTPYVYTKWCYGEHSWQALTAAMTQAQKAAP